MSHDIENVVTVVDGRPALIDELPGAAEELRTYVAQGDFAAPCSLAHLNFSMPFRAIFWATPRGSPACLP